MPDSDPGSVAEEWGLSQTFSNGGLIRTHSKRTPLLNSTLVVEHYARSATSSRVLALEVFAGELTIIFDGYVLISEAAREDLDREFMEALDSVMKRGLKIDRRHFSTRVMPNGSTYGFEGRGLAKWNLRSRCTLVPPLSH